MIKQISKNERIQSKKKPWTDIIPNLKFGRKGKSYNLTREQSVATKFRMWSKQEKQGGQ